ncbi:mitosis inhibitor protein kinase swe1 [Coemansia sp. RSA 2618]|nr:mitosis inhibitor protein kinase swe1 [Coemansia sp. RSA 2618]
MAETPRPVKRGLRKNNTCQGMETPYAGSNRRMNPGLRTCVSFPALAEVRDEVATPTPGKRTSGLLEQLTPRGQSPSERISLLGRLASGARQSPGERQSLLGRLTPGVRQSPGIRQSLDGQSPGIRQSLDGQSPSFRQGLDGQSPSFRQSLDRQSPGERQSLLGRLTPGARHSRDRHSLDRHSLDRQSPGLSEQHSPAGQLTPGTSPTPSRTPFPGRAQRRLTFTPALFTPPATKLVRPDPRAFASTGLQSKKQQARTRAPDSAWRGTPSRTPDAARLGKHRASTDSLRRTRKKAHIGPEETPVRTRRDTLVDERPPALRLSGLPPAFAPQHAQLLQSLDDGWGDAASESSSAATLTVSPDATRAALFETRDAMDVDGSASTSAAEDDDDVFGRIDADERPQMPQIVQGCATNYAHFVGREYFCGAARPFLAPGDEFRVDGLGYLDYFAHQFEVLGRAGEGDFATVSSVRSLDDGQLYAVKRTRRPYAGRAERARRLREPELLWAVPASASIVRLFSAWEQFGHLFLQFELCERGSLAGYLDACAAEHISNPHAELMPDHMSQAEYMPEPRAWAVLAHAAHAVGLLHAQGIAHLDIKPANFLLGADFDVPGAEQHAGWLKLADFGHAVRLPRDPLAWVEEGDRQYMAPEVLRGEYTPAADVFSLGMMMLEIIADIVLPENGADWHKLREGCFDDPCFAGLPYAPPLLELVKSMLHPQPAHRPTLPQVLDQCHLLPVSAASTPLVSEDDDDDDAAFVRLQRHHSFNHAFTRPPRPALMRAATASTADELQSSSAHPMVTRSAAKATDPPTTTSGLARRTASAI